MKTLFKRALAVLSIMAIAATGAVANTAVSAEDAENLAPKAIACKVDSDNSQHSGTAEIPYGASDTDGGPTTDGNFATRWQSNMSGADADNMAWISYEFAEAISFNTIDIYWETARASGEGTAILISENGTDWTAVTKTSDSGDGAETNYDSSTDKKARLRSFTFNTVTAKYLKLEFTALQDSQKEHPSIWEIEIYNKAGLSMAGANIRTNAEDETKYDLRFVTNFSSELYADIADITDLGVILVRADELETAGKTTADINLDLAADGLTVRKVPATYLRNIDLATTGNYTYTVTITGIADTSVEYVCVGYYTTADGTVYTDAMTRSVADGLAA